MKAVVSAGLELVVVPMLREGDQLRTDLQAVRHHIERLGPDNIVAVVSTTSCFAPRSADNVVELARLAASAGEDSCRCNPIACFVGAEQGRLHLLPSLAMQRIHDGLVSSTQAWCLRASPRRMLLRSMLCCSGHTAMCYHQVSQTWCPAPRIGARVVNCPQQSLLMLQALGTSSTTHMECSLPRCAG